MTYDRAAIWIKYASWFLGLSGLVVGLAASPTTNAAALVFADGLFWPFDGRQSLDAPETRLVAAICAGMMIGLAVVYWMLADQGFRLMPDLSRRIILWSIGVWFVTDSVGSIMAGAHLNVVGNLFYLAIFVVPLVQIAADKRLSPQTE